MMGENSIIPLDKNTHANKLAKRGIQLLEEAQPSSSPLPSSTNSKEILEQDIVPLHLGYEAEDGGLQIIFRKGTVIPCKTIQTLELRPNIRGKSVLVLYQGLMSFARDNIHLVDVIIKPKQRSSGARAGISVRISIEIDHDGILTISDIVDAKNNSKLEFTLSNSSKGMSKEDVASYLKNFSS